MDHSTDVQLHQLGKSEFLSISLDQSFLIGGGNLGHMIAAFDWASTPLGPIQDWPQSLKTSVSILLNSRQPMFVAWGPERTFIYNDAYIEVLSLSKHPWALGRPFAEVWAEIWDVCGPLCEKVFKKGEASFVDNVRLFMKRIDYLEETFYSFSYSAIRDERGVVQGLFCASAETTAKMLNERRLKTLGQMSTRSLQAKSIDSACDSVIETLGTNPDDIPFALFYLMNGDQPNLMRSVGLSQRVCDDEFHQALLAGRFQVLDLDPSRFCLPALAGQFVKQAVVLPVVSSTQERPLGVLIVGVNPCRELGVEYQTFYNLLAGQVGIALQSARAFEEEKRRVEALAEIDRAKTQFFSNVSHEFRTPLTLMLGPLEDLLADSSQDWLKPQLALIHRNSLRLLKLVNSLLDFSRIEAGRVQARYRPTDLAVLTADVASVFRSAVEKAGLEFQVQTASLSESVFVDREMWEKIVLNLISNAFKFTFEGRIQVKLYQEGHEVVLTVADTGIGIPASEMPRVFERFHRVEGAQGRTHEGTGIGLALIQELAKLHGGRITLESEEGLGTAFHVRIPLGSAHLPMEHIYDSAAATRPSGLGVSFVEEALRWLPEDLGQQKAAVPRIRIDKERRRILLVDDNADMRSYVRGLLEEFWEVEAVADGEAAWAAALSNPPDLILSDVMMPRLDGFGLIARLRANASTSSIPVVLLSARAGEESRIEGLDAGADDYLVKPFSSKELLARVRTHLELGRLRVESEAERNKMHSVFMKAPVAIAVLEGPQHVYALANELYMSIGFRGERPILGKAIREAIPELEGQGFYELLDQVYRSGEAFVGTEMPVRVTQADGSVRLVYVNFVYEPRRNHRGEVDGIIVVFSDVTEQVQARQKIEEAICARDEFLSIAAHELKTPVTSLKLQLQMARRQINLETNVTPTPSKLAQVFDTTNKQVNRLTLLLEDLLNVSRIQAGRLEYRFEETRLRPIFENVLERFSGELEATGTTVHLNVPEDLVGFWDESRIEQVVVNLVSNAIKYAPGKPVRIDSRAISDGVEFTVRDSGRGIPADKREIIFERFERASASRDIGGLGLGLFISKKIVESHGGRIYVEDAEGQGSRFVVQLPRSCA